MIKVTILYPNTTGSRFDKDYYFKTHMPLAAKLLGDSLRAVTVERGVSLGAPWPEPANVIICTMVFDSREALESGMLPNLPALTADIPRFTDVQPVIQISEIVLDQTGTHKVAV